MGSNEIQGGEGTRAPKLGYLGYCGKLNLELNLKVALLYAFTTR